MDDSLPAFLTLLLMPLTYSITNGMILGLLASIGFYFTTGKFWLDIKYQYERRQRRWNATAVQPATVVIDESTHEEQLPIVDKEKNGSYGSSVWSVVSSKQICNFVHAQSPIYSLVLSLQFVLGKCVF